jgi:hypothetical protein
MTNKLTLKQEFAVFPENKEQLIKLADDYKNLVVTEETFEQSKKARLVIRQERYDIQKIEKANNSILNDLKKQNKAIAGDLIEIIQPTENKIDEQIKAIEAKKAEEKAEKERQKAEQMAEWVQKATSILNYTDDLFEAESLLEVNKVVDEISNLDLTEESYGAYLLIAQQNAAKVMEQSKIAIERINKALEAAEALIAQQREAELKRVQEAEQRKVEELVSARVAYKEYFHNIPDVELEAADLLGLIETDKQLKLDKLAELEELEEAKADWKQYFNKPLPKKYTKESLLNDLKEATKKIAKRVVIYESEEEKEFKEWIENIIKTHPKCESNELITKVESIINFIKNV